MKVQKDTYPDQAIPWFIKDLTNSVLKLDGLQTKDIFRYHTYIASMFIFIFNVVSA